MTIPRIPSYERDRDEVDKFHEHWKKSSLAKAKKGGHQGWSCDVAYTSHLKVVAKYEEPDKELLMTVQFHFPNNMKCNNKYFNDGAGNDYKLIPKLVGVKLITNFLHH